MDLREWLETSFRYERWATDRWIEFYPSLPEPNQAEPVLLHILWALEIWLFRVDPSFEVSKGSMRARLQDVTEGWSKALAEIDPSTVIAYQNTSCRAFEHQLGAIAGHVIHHGSYHRGQLRAIADEQGVSEFPETDLIVFFRVNQLFGPRQE